MRSPTEAVPALPAVAERAPVVRACSTEPMPPAWPGVQVLALFHAPGPELTDDTVRAAARRSALQVLLEHAGHELAAPCLERPRHLRGAQPVSISHDARLSLLAWCPEGAVGIDLVMLDSLARASPQELAATAALYLGPQAAERVAAPVHAVEARMRFALHWAEMEARLKCLGLELDEWHPARAPCLATVGSVRVLAVDADGQACTEWVGCVAWRPRPIRGSVSTRGDPGGQGR